MEKIQAAYTMDWSIQLDKGLRSKKPGVSIEAILKIGKRLEQWNVEPPFSIAAYNMFGLVHNEDRLFANTILLRLAQVFKDGDNSVRLAVVKVFLSEYRHRKTKSYNGIFSESVVDNAFELLTRVKFVFVTGDVQSRAFSLILFGCWANFAKDNCDIRYLILSSLISSHVVEAKASIFAARCFSELLDDFSHVVLKILMDTVTSPERMPSVRLVGARAFSSLGCSSSFANRAYKVSKKLLLESLDDDMLVALLTSLSKLASRSILLISEQVVLLFSYLAQATTLQVKTSALRCLRNILAKGVSHFVVTEHTVQTLFCLLNEPQLSSAMQCEVLWILHKILIYRLPDVLCTNKLELSKLFIIVEDRSQSSFTENRILAMRILVNLSGKLSGRTEMECDVGSSDSLPSRVISIIIDQLIFVVKHGQDFGRTQAEAESQSLFNLLLCLVEECLDLHILVLSNIHLVIENIVESNRKRSTSISSKFLIYIYKFLVVFLEILNKDGSISKEIFQKMELIVRDVHLCSLFNSFTHTLYSLLLSSYIIWDRATILGMNNLVELEDISLVYVTKMLLQGDNWHVYKAGLHTACQGSWSMTAFVFENLITKVQSSSFYYWLECLDQFAKSEREIQLLSIQINEFHLPEYREKLVSAYSFIVLSCAALEGNATTSEDFYFQNWFLNIRAKVVEAVLNIHEVLVTFSSDQDSIINKEWDKRFCLITHCLTRLSKKIDLMVTSFVGMDRISVEVISALALSCLVLAFSTAFVRLVSEFTPHGNSYAPGLKKSENISSLMLIENLMVRLRHVDHDTCTKLRSLSKMTGQTKKFFHLDSRNQIISCGGSDIKKILSLCSYAVDGVIHLRNVDTVHKEEILVKATKDGVQLLSDVIKKWIHIPFRSPKSFFRLRPCIGSEIFAINSDLNNSDDISVLAGSHLSLNVCLQLKNVPSDHPIHLSKLYCILYCKTSFEIPPSSNEENKGQTWFGAQGWESDDMVDLNDQLSEYVRRKKTKSHHCTDKDKEGGAATTYLCFQPNERGQGFSTCLVDVSGFPAGSYETRWLSCCIDSQGLYWSLLPLNAGPVFNIQSSVFK